MIGSAKLDVSIYEEVEADTNATRQAMGVVLLSSLASGIGSLGFGATGITEIVTISIFALLGWVTWAFLTYIIGTRLLPEPQTRADVGELMRTLGFAQSVGVLRVLSLVPIIGPILLPVVSIWQLVCMVVAVRHALDYQSTLRAIAVVIIAGIPYGILLALLYG